MTDYISEHTGAEIDAGVRPYKVYTALLTQSGPYAPVATVLENTIGNIVWTRGDVGVYYATLVGEFTVGKTAIFINGIMNNGEDINRFIVVRHGENADYMIMDVFNVDGDDHVELTTGGYIFPIEIRIYP